MRPSVVHVSRPRTSGSWPQKNGCSNAVNRWCGTGPRASTRTASRALRSSRAVRRFAPKARTGTSTAGRSRLSSRSSTCCRGRCNVRLASASVWRSTCDPLRHRQSRYLRSLSGSVEPTPVKPLERIRVVEAATLFAAPIAGMLLGDYGAEVIKIEHPRRPDPARGHGPAKDGVGLWFKTLARNKRLATLDLSQTAGRDVFLRLAERSDVVIENFRPGTLERWSLGWDELRAVNPRLVLARVSGFGQRGPYAARPGFGTLAEAMSGFASLNGAPGSPPLLPPLALADGIAGFATAFAI